MTVLASDDALIARWKGQRGRLEVWYLTLSEPASGLGLWVHHELVSPLVGEPYAHGWAALFKTGDAPVLERFGPSALDREALGSVPGATLSPPMARGDAGALSWDLRWEDGPSKPLWTFPRWTWQREMLPAAQVVPVPAAAFSGRVGDIELRNAPGCVAHIYGHGSAERWAWLHADLGGGDLLEIVAAVSRRGGLNRLPPLAFVQLRMGGKDWPRDPLTTSVLFRSRLGLPQWSVRGGTPRRRLHVEVRVPEEESAKVGYVDPDGSTATCTNSEISDAEIVVQTRRSGRWETERSWKLDGTAHAEVGTRP